MNDYIIHVLNYYYLFVFCFILRHNERTETGDVQQMYLSGPYIILIYIYMNYYRI